VAVAEAAPVPAASGDFERSLEGLLGRNVMCVTREVEWGTVLLGFEQVRRRCRRAPTT
jgi:hypothetical protein